MNTKWSWQFRRRIAIMAGAGFVPGMNAVVMGAALAAGELGWEMVGIRDGFDGVLHPERYPDGGLVTLSPQLVENLDPAAGGILGQSGRVDPFHVRTINEDDMVQEVDMSDDLLKALKAEQIDAVISVVGGRGLSILYKLHRKGLNTVCIPRSIENDIAATRCPLASTAPSASPSKCSTGLVRRPSLPARSPWWRSWASRPDGWRCRPALPLAPMRC